MPKFEVVSEYTPSGVYPPTARGWGGAGNLSERGGGARGVSPQKHRFCGGPGI